MTKKTNADLIIEDVLYYEEKDGKYVSTAEDTFYFQFLMQRADFSINGQNNLKAATDFKNYEEIYVALMNLGLLNDERYCLDFTKIYGGACFSFNLGLALHDLKLKEILEIELKGRVSSDCLKTFLNPADSFRCSVCGAVSLSRHITFMTDGKKTTYCLSCYPINKEIHPLIQKIYHEKGSLPAVRERIRLIDEQCKIHIADGMTIDKLLDDFIADNKDYNNHYVETIDKIFKYTGRNEFQTFAYDDTGVVIIDRNKARDINLFSEFAALNPEGDEILALFDRAGVCWCDENAIRLAIKLLKSKAKEPDKKTSEWLALLKEYKGDE